MSRLLIHAIALMTLTSATMLRAQRPTIPDVLAAAGQSLRGGPLRPSGPPFSVDHVVEKADVIVRGTIGPPSQSYLSDDQREVYTDYSIQNATVLFTDNSTVPFRSGETPTLAVTILGGSLTINGLTFISEHEALPSLRSGSDCLLLLHREGSKYFPVYYYYGAFDVTRGVVTPLIRKPGFAEALTGRSVSEVATQLVARARELHHSRR